MLYEITEHQGCIFVTYNPEMFDDIGSASLITYYDKNNNAKKKKEKISKRRGFSK